MTLWSADELRAQTQCPVCGAPAPAAIVAERRDHLGVRECPRCRLLFIDPVPSDAALLRCYDADYYSGRAHRRFRIGYETPRPSAAAEDGGSDRVSAPPVGYAELVANFDLRGYSILEVGCSDGALLAALRNCAPARLVGIDVSADAIDRGRMRRGLDLRCARLRADELGAGAFDLVIMIDVIEHLTNLRVFFGQAASCLKPDGAMFIATPNARAGREGGARWQYLDRALEHVAYPSLASLACLARAHGLAIDRAWSEGLPVGLAAYRRKRRSRALRLALEPEVALTNAWRRWRHRSAVRRGCGLDLRVILRKCG